MVILIYITKSASWKAPNGQNSRRGKAHYALYLHKQNCLLEGGRYVEKNFTFVNWPSACSGANLLIVLYPNAGLGRLPDYGIQSPQMYPGVIVLKVSLGFNPGTQSSGTKGYIELIFTE